MIGVGNDDQWRKFCAAVRENNWAADPRFTTNAQRVVHREELLALVRPLVRQRTRLHWQELLSAIGVPHGPVHSVDEALAGAQAAAREMILPVVDNQGRSYSLLASPIHYQDEPRRQAIAPPDLASIPTKCCATGCRSIAAASPRCAKVGPSHDEGSRNTGGRSVRSPRG